MKETMNQRKGAKNVVAGAGIISPESGNLPAENGPSSCPSSPSKSLSRFIPPLSLYGNKSSTQINSQTASPICGNSLSNFATSLSHQPPIPLLLNIPPTPSNPTVHSDFNLGQSLDAAASLDMAEAKPLQPKPPFISPGPHSSNPAQRLLPSTQIQQPPFSDIGLATGPIAFSNNPLYLNSAQTPPIILPPDPNPNSSNYPIQNQFNSQPPSANSIGNSHNQNNSQTHSINSPKPVSSNSVGPHPKSTPCDTNSSSAATDNNLVLSALPNSHGLDVNSSPIVTLNSLL